jgi:hypothetical protein
VIDRRDETRRGVRRTALIFTGVALVFYLGFILLGVLRS